MFNLDYAIHCKTNLGRVFQVFLVILLSGFLKDQCTNGKFFVSVLIRIFLLKILTTVESSIAVKKSVYSIK